MAPRLPIPSNPLDIINALRVLPPMARDVADTRLMFEALVGPDRRDPFGQAASCASPPGGSSVRPISKPHVSILNQIKLYALG